MKRLIKIINNRAAGSIILAFILFFASGYLLGRFTGYKLLEGILLKDRKFPFLLSKPVSEFYNVYIRVNSNNMFNRLSGYYSLLDNNMLNTEFLMERFKSEKDICAKRTIIWILRFSDDPDTVLEFFSRIYGKSNVIVKKEILRTMKRVDREYFGKFIAEKKIKGRILHDL